MTGQHWILATDRATSIAISTPNAATSIKRSDWKSESSEYKAPRSREINFCIQTTTTASMHAQRRRKRRGPAAKSHQLILESSQTIQAHRRPVLDAIARSID